MVSFILAGTTLVGNVIEDRGTKTVVRVGNITYLVPTASLRTFDRKKK